MNPIFQRLMRNVTRLVARGDVKAATDAIQAALAKEATPPAQAAPPPSPPPPAPAFAAPPSVIVLPDASRATPPPAPSAAPSPPGPGRVIAGSHGDALVRRDFKLFVPAQAGGGPLPLVVMLHGCTQDADDFAAGTGMNELAREQGFYVLYPEQARHANPQRCWNWFKHSHQERGRGEPELIAGMTRSVMEAHAIDPARVYVAGLSAGGAMAAIMGETYPELFAAVGVHSGLAAGAARDLPSAFGAMQGRSPVIVPSSPSGIPTIVFHGDADVTVHPDNSGQVIAASVDKDTVVELAEGVAAGGRSFTRELHRSANGGPVIAEHWVVHGAPHAWSGGQPDGSYTDPTGPDASAEMVRFFLTHARQPIR